jgi:HAD superfamily hydrolase (TIGR01509 family)
VVFGFDPPTGEISDFERKAFNANASDLIIRDERTKLSNVRHSAITTIVFDWDGTLADSAGLGLAAFQKTFADLGFPFPLDVYESAYSPNWYSTYESLGLPREKWQQADDLWLKHYGEENAQLIEGVGATLKDLDRRNYRLAVVTSGSESRVCREIDQSELRGVFKTVVCNEHIVNKKPHPEGLEIALQRLQSEPGEAAYVGDAPEDIAMGRSANVLTVGVHGNYPSSRRLVQSKPDIYLESLKDLLKHF